MPSSPPSTPLTTDCHGGPSTGRANPAPLGRPPNPAKRRAILDAARAEFLRHGAEGFAMEAVAARAGVSKVTVYKQFESREGLLAALVGAESDWMEAVLTMPLMGEEPNGVPVREQLRAWARPLVAFLARRDVRDFDAAMQLAAGTHQGLVAAFVAAGPARLQAALEAALRAETEAGRLGPEPPSLMAADLMALLLGTVPPPVRFGLAPEPSADEQAWAADRAVDAFLRLHGSVA